MKRQNNYYVEQREVNLKRMITTVLYQWRIMLVVALIAAVLMGMKQYKSDVAAEEARIQAAIAAANAPEVTVEYLESQLIPQQIQNVKTAVDYYLVGERRQNYMDESIYMNIDPYKVNVAKITYNFSLVSPVSFANEVSTAISSGDMANSLISELGLQIESRYITELISLPVTDSVSYCTMQVMGKTEEEALELAEAVIAELNKIVAKYENAYPDAEIEAEEIECMIVKDDTLINLKNAYISEIYTYNSAYVNLYNAFAGAQIQLFNMLLEEAHSNEGMLFSQEIEENVTTQESAAAEVDMTIHAGISVKMMLIGAIVGAIIAFAVLALLYTISKRIHGEEEAVYLFGVPAMGSVSVLALKKKKVLGTVDKWLEKLFAGKKNYLSYEQQLQLTCSNVQIQCEKQGYSKIYLSGSEWTKVPKQILDELRDILKTKQIEVLWKENVMLDATSRIEMTQADAVLLVELAEKSNCEEMARELNLCKQNQVPVLGMLMLERA